MTGREWVLGRIAKCQEMIAHGHATAYVFAVESADAWRETFGGEPPVGLNGIVANASAMGATGYGTSAERRAVDDWLAALGPDPYRCARGINTPDQCPNTAPEYSVLCDERRGK